MFRRRTDQVYSTLQQVQRRITEQNGPQADPGELAALPPQPAVNLQPLSQALPTGGLPVLTPPVVQQPFAGVPAARLPPGGSRYVLQISGDLAMLLVVMWLISMALMFVLGQHWRSTGGAGLAAGAAGNRETPLVQAPSGKRLGDWVYVLKSQPHAPVDAVNQYESEARTLNEAMRQPQNASRGWKPYFGVRKPVNGGVELVYGLADGVWGVDKADFAAFAKLLAEPASKSGGGYASARWVKVDQ